MRELLRICLGTLITLALCPRGAIAEEEVPSKIADDERVVFFPQAARESTDGKFWTIPVHGWIFEPEVSDLKRRALLRGLKADLNLATDKASVSRFEKRARYFLVDDERGKRVGIRLANHRFTLPESTAAGHFQRELIVRKSAVDAHVRKGWLLFDVPLPAGSSRAFGGKVRLRPPTGLTVISDIDDTVKVSHVLNKTLLIANTFLNEFQAVDGMPELYREWEKKGADFTFVSASPWQLYPELHKWMAAEKFPPATFQLRQIRFRDSSLLKLFDDPFASKVSRVSTLLKRFPKRKFILVGDSGEKDPEVYGELARKFPSQIVVSLIRNVTNETAASPRMQNAFREVDSKRWQVFDTPGDIQLPDGVFIKDTNGER